MKNGESADLVFRLAADAFRRHPAKEKVAFRPGMDWTLGPDRVKMQYV